MSSWPAYISALVLAYLTGAIPFSYIIGKLKGVDIRQAGSGNVGATNVMRTVGKPWGLLAFACDCLKGLAAATVIPQLIGRVLVLENMQIAAIACGCAAIIGHNWPVFLKFKGGKGVATTAGALLGIAPAAMAIGLAAWLIVFGGTRYVSVASMMAGIVTAIAAWGLPCYRTRGAIIPITLTILAILVVIRHTANIKRLLSGTESRANPGSKPKNSS